MQAALKILAVLFVLTLPACAYQSERSKRAERFRRLYDTPTPPPTPQDVAVGEELAREFKALLVAAYPSYNGIVVRYVGTGLLATHPLFTGYEFDAGPLGPAVQRFIDENRDAMIRLGIVRVCITPNSGGYYGFGVRPREEGAR